MFTVATAIFPSTSIVETIYIRCMDLNLVTEDFVYNIWTPADLVLKAEMLLELTPLTAVIIAELALVRLDLSVLLQVQLQGLVAGACEGAFVATEHQALKVA